MNNEITIQIASEEHLKYVDVILKTIADAAKVRGTGLAKRDPQYVSLKIKEGKAIIALAGEEFAGFCYIESWGHDKFVANSGLIVVEKFRGRGLARDIKYKAFELSRTKFPNAKLFGLTTGLAVMKINSELGYKPVTFSELTDDKEFWKGCQSCVNYDILLRTNFKHCLCTGMLYDPEKEEDNKSKFALKAEIQSKMSENSKTETKKTEVKKNEKWSKFKKILHLKNEKEKKN